MALNIRIGLLRIKPNTERLLVASVKQQVELKGLALNLNIISTLITIAIGAITLTRYFIYSLIWILNLVLNYPNFNKRTVIVIELQSPHQDPEESPMKSARPNEED